MSGSAATAPRSSHRAARSTLARSGLALGLLLATVGIAKSDLISQASVGAGSVTEVQITGQAGIAADASAVAINLAAVSPAAAGYLTAYPCGTSRPTASTVNYDTSMATSNSSIVKIGTGGKICIYSLTATDILVDVTGWYPANADYTPITPNRLLDTRPANRATAGATKELQITGRAGVAANASAVAINLAAVSPAAAGYLTAYPCGTDRPTASTVNYDTSMATSNSSIVKIGTGGKICIYSLTATDILVDVTGWYPAAADYTPNAPNRLLDTRATARATASAVQEVQVTGRAGVAADASAVAINLAAVSPAAAGYLTAYPCGTDRPTASTVNYDTSMATSNSSIVKIGTGGKICIYSLTATDILVDVTGWYPANADYTPITPNRLLDTRPATPPAAPPAVPPVAPPGTPGTPTPPVTPPVVLPPNAFYEPFTGNTGLERFETGMYHRDDFLVAQTQWTGDHDLNCGDPATQRTVLRSNPAQAFYLCRDHLMTSVGDTSGYSIAWFAPRQTFQGGVHTKVSFDVGVTDLGNRKWWEVSIVPVGAPYLATLDFVAIAAEIPIYDDQSVVVGKGPYGNDGNIFTDGVARDPLGWGHVCGGDAADPEGCDSKAIRRTFTITDNLNGTITFDYLGTRYTYPGQFPDQFEVYFKDHNYTPDKDGVPVGHTWHWDNILIT